MHTDEFNIIDKYFSFPSARTDVNMAGGDDCAIVTPPGHQQLLITTDTLISGVHFPVDTAPEDIAYKSLMVNLSDLAAMGATPAWVTLAISLPEIDHDWLQRFSDQFSELLTRYEIALIGGDTTRAPLSVTIQAMGFSDAEKILRRDLAKPGDSIYVTGNIGDAAVGLQAINDNLKDTELAPCIQRLNRPDARVVFAQSLSELCRCAIDISDGLLADLGHILNASACGAQLSLSKISISTAAQYYFKHYHDNEIDWPMLLTRGDDYELCFTADKNNHQAIQTLAQKHQLDLSCIGEINTSQKMEIVDTANRVIEFGAAGYKHF